MAKPLPVLIITRASRFSETYENLRLASPGLSGRKIWWSCYQSGSQESLRSLKQVASYSYSGYYLVWRTQTLKRRNVRDVGKAKYSSKGHEKLLVNMDLFRTKFWRNVKWRLSGGSGRTRQKPSGNIQHVSTVRTHEFVNCTVCSSVPPGQPRMHTCLPLFDRLSTTSNPFLKRSIDF